MIDTIVTSTSNTSIISTSSEGTSIIAGNASQPTIILSGIMGPKGSDGAVASTMDALSDVDLTNLQEGSLLIYSTSQSKWFSSNVLNNQVLEAGQF